MVTGLIEAGFARNSILCLVDLSRIRALLIRFLESFDVFTSNYFLLKKTPIGVFFKVRGWVVLEKKERRGRKEGRIKGFQ